MIHIELLPITKLRKDVPGMAWSRSLLSTNPFWKLYHLKSFLLANMSNFLLKMQLIFKFILPDRNDLKWTKQSFA